MPGDIGETALQEMLSASLHLSLASVSVLGVEHDVTDGNSYTSDMSRMRARLVTEDGERREVSLLVKQSMLDHTDNEVLKHAGELTTEIKMYQDVLPKMEMLIMKLGKLEDSLWAHCIGHYDNNTLVLEDLKELGYSTCDRSIGLDYPHASLAVRSLARFHALSVALRNAGLLNPQDFSKFVFAGEFGSVNDFITSSFHCLHSIATMEWTPAWRDIIENVRRIPDMVVDKLREMTRLDKSKCHVLNHGDPWVNNIMFSYTKDDIPQSAKFVDFQLSHYNSYAFDLHYLMNTSVSVEVLHHIDRLYEEYHEELTSEFSLLGLPDCPSLAEVLGELERTEFFGLFSAVCIAPVITAGPEIAPLKDQAGYTLAELEKRKKDRFRTYEYTRRIQVILRRAQLGGLFKRLFD